MLYRKEYYKHPYYFFLKEGKETITLYFSVQNTLSEARKKDEKISFNKKDKKYVEKELTKIFQDKKSKSTEDVKKKLEKVKSEIEELVDYDGTFLSSKVPILNPKLAPKGTIDQEVVQNRQPNNPLIRGYRVYWGESEDEEGNVVSEIDYSDAFGFEETEDMDFKNTVNTLKKMGVENPVHRAKELGKLPKAKKRNGKLRQRLSEKDSIEEQERKKMVKMVEDILTKKSNKDSDILKKDNDSSVSKFLIKNLQSIKKLADKEGISISKLINILKTSE